MKLQMLSQKKQQLRQQIRDRLHSLEISQRQCESFQLNQILIKLWQSRQQPDTAAFYPMPHEVDIRGYLSYLWSCQRVVWLPRCLRDRRLSWHPIRHHTQLKRGPLGLLQPDPRQVSAKPLPAGALVVVPGLAWGREGQRLGQGGGYYDRFLPTCLGRAIKTIGVGFSCQQIDELPEGPRDCRVEGVLLAGQWLKRPPNFHLAPGE